MDAGGDCFCCEVEEEVGSRMACLSGCGKSLCSEAVIYLFLVAGGGQVVEMELPRGESCNWPNALAINSSKTSVEHLLINTYLWTPAGAKRHSPSLVHLTHTHVILLPHISKTYSSSSKGAIESLHRP